MSGKLFRKAKSCQLLLKLKLPVAKSRCTSVPVLPCNCQSFRSHINLFMIIKSGLWPQLLACYCDMPSFNKQFVIFSGEPCVFGNVCDSVLPVSHIGPLTGSADVYSRIVLEFQAYNRLFIYTGHTNTRINTPWLSNRHKQRGIAVEKKTFTLRPDRTKLKKRTLVTTCTFVSSWGSQPGSVEHFDMWGQGTVDHLQINAPYLGRVGHNKKDVLQHKEVNVLHLMEKRRF